MPKLVNRLSEKEIKRANEEHDKRHGSPTDLRNRGRLGKPGRDYSEAHQKRVAEWRQLADPNCAKCSGKGYTVKFPNVFNTERLRYEGPSLLFSGYKVACSCTKREEP
jgi:hypothetical protein